METDSDLNYIQNSIFYEFFTTFKVFYIEIAQNKENSFLLTYFIAILFSMRAPLEMEARFLNILSKRRKISTNKKVDKATCLC